MHTDHKLSIYTHDRDSQNKKTKKTKALSKTLFHFRLPRLPLSFIQLRGLGKREKSTWTHMEKIPLLQEKYMGSLEQALLKTMQQR